MPYILSVSNTIQEHSISMRRSYCTLLSSDVKRVSVSNNIHHKMCVLFSALNSASTLQSSHALIESAAFIKSVN